MRAVKPSFLKPRTVKPFQKRLETANRQPLRPPPIEMKFLKGWLSTNCWRHAYNQLQPWIGRFLVGATMKFEDVGDSQSELELTDAWCWWEQICAPFVWKQEVDTILIVLDVREIMKTITQPEFKRFDESWKIDLANIHFCFSWSLRMLILWKIHTLENGTRVDFKSFAIVKCLICKLEEECIIAYQHVMGESVKIVLGHCSLDINPITFMWNILIVISCSIWRFSEGASSRKSLLTYWFVKAGHNRVNFKTEWVISKM